MKTFATTFYKDSRGRNHMIKLKLFSMSMGSKCVCGNLCVNRTGQGRDMTNINDMNERAEAKWLVNEANTFQHTHYRLVQRRKANYLNFDNA